MPSTHATLRKTYPAYSLPDSRNEYRHPKSKSNPIPCACRSPLEETVEPDISTLLGTRRRQTVELYASRHIFPACNRVSQRAGVHNRKISTGARLPSRMRVRCRKES